MQLETADGNIHSPSGKTTATTKATPKSINRMLAVQLQSCVLFGFEHQVVVLAADWIQRAEGACVAGAAAAALSVASQQAGSDKCTAC
jgi:hypothetical protein